uniref:Uncharacterized protein n=1 Tax=Romanomermis culicivorax TaxID=13658 RepID=A0A915I4D5_ROMCU
MISTKTCFFQLLLLFILKVQNSQQEAICPDGYIERDACAGFLCNPSNEPKVCCPINWIPGQCILAERRSVHAKKFNRSATKTEFD